MSEHGTDISATPAVSPPAAAAVAPAPPLARSAVSPPPDAPILKCCSRPAFWAPANEAQLEAGDVLLSKPYHKRDLAKAVEQVLSAPA